MPIPEAEHHFEPGSNPLQIHHMVPAIPDLMQIDEAKSTQEPNLTTYELRNHFDTGRHSRPAPVLNATTEPTTSPTKDELQEKISILQQRLITSRMAEEAQQLKFDETRAQIEVAHAQKNDQASTTGNPEFDFGRQSA